MTATMTTGLERFGSLTLAELNDRAARLTRVDRKYILPAAALAGVLAELPHDTAVLEIAGERALRYESRYFDTPTLDSYLGAARGRRASGARRAGPRRSSSA